MTFLYKTVAALSFVALGIVFMWMTENTIRKTVDGNVSITYGVWVAITYFVVGLFLFLLCWLATQYKPID
jgi:hypothetical protein